MIIFETETDLKLAKLEAGLVVFTKGKTTVGESAGVYIIQTTDPGAENGVGLANTNFAKRLTILGEVGLKQLTETKESLLQDINAKTTVIQVASEDIALSESVKTGNTNKLYVWPEV